MLETVEIDAPVIRNLSGTPLITSVKPQLSPVLVSDGATVDIPLSDFLNIESLPPDHSVTIVSPNGKALDSVKFNRETHSFSVGIPPDAGNSLSARVIIGDGDNNGALFTISAERLKTGQEQPAQQAQQTTNPEVQLETRVGTVSHDAEKIPGFVSVQMLSPETFPEGEPFSYEVPSDTFVHENASEPLKYTATMADGSPLPGWVTFNSETQTFSGEAPADSVQSLDVMVKAIDRASQEAVVQMRIQVG